ncbi:MAG: hypothetical protein ACXWUG_14985 [Polyangiales bacterium]
MSPRDAILRRRARFVSAALVLAGCHPKDESVKASAVPSAESKSAQKPQPPKAPPPVKPPPDRPAMTPTVSTTGEAKRAAAAARIEKVEKAIEELAGAIPIGCDLGDPVCRGRFKVFADEIAKLREQTHALHPPGCPPKLADDIAVDRMVLDQRAWLGRWIDDIEKAGRASADAIADSGTAWDDLKSDAEKAYAHPCLSFACP